MSQSDYLSCARKAQTARQSDPSSPDNAREKRKVRTQNTHAATHARHKGNTKEIGSPQRTTFPFRNNHAAPGNGTHRKGNSLRSRSLPPPVNHCNIRAGEYVVKPRPHPHEHSIRTRNFSRTDRPTDRALESRNSIETAAAIERPRSRLLSIKKERKESRKKTTRARRERDRKGGGRGRDEKFTATCIAFQKAVLGERSLLFAEGCVGVRLKYPG